MAFTSFKLRLAALNAIAVFGFVPILLVGIPSIAIAQGDIEHMNSSGQDIRKIEIAPGVYQFMTMRDAYVRQLNSVAIVNERDVLVFDTNTRPSSARIILAEIRKITDKPVRYVVNSHWHPDHWSGNAVYADAFAGVEVIATEETLRFMHSSSPAWPARFTAEERRVKAALETEIATGKQADGTLLTPEAHSRDELDFGDYASF